MERKVLAYRRSQEVDGRRAEKEEVSVVDSRTENGVTTYRAHTGRHRMYRYLQYFYGRFLCGRRVRRD